MAVTDIIRALAALVLLVASGGVVVAVLALRRWSHAASRQADAIERIAAALARPAPDRRD